MAEPASSAPAAILTQPELEAWGRAVGESAAEGGIGLPLVIALRGTLGAGKSVLARAIARGAGVTSPMPSPTYNLLFTYETDGVVVHHLDLYRLEAPDDVWELGWEELGQGDELVLIEWPERAEPLLPRDRWEVRLSSPGKGAGAGGGEGVEGVEGIEGVEGVEGLRVVGVEAVGSAPVPPRLPASGSASGSGSGSGAGS